jgi:hypothetical protein
MLDKEILNLIMKAETDNQELIHNMIKLRKDSHLWIVLTQL